MERLELRPPDFSCIVAADDRRGIGKGGQLPWPRLRGDLAHFRAITTKTKAPGSQNAVIMGRATWDSIPEEFRPLPGRLNVVLSRKGLSLPEGVRQAPSLDEALTAATAAGVEGIYVIGGGQVYAEAFAHPRCRAVYLTSIAQIFDCDTFIPPLEPAYYPDTGDTRMVESGVAYQITRWLRVGEYLTPPKVHVND